MNTSLLRALRAMAEALPPGASVNLPADWLREQLKDEGAASQEKRVVKGMADLTVEQVAAELDRSPSTVRGFLIAGELVGYKFRGKEWRVTRESLARFIEAQRPSSEDSPIAATPRKRGSRVDLGSWRDHLKEAS